MKIRYDPDADAMYIELRNGKVDHTKELDENTIIDYDKDETVLGIEILFVKEILNFLRNLKLNSIIRVICNF